ncbi:hypothetical protein [Nonomuraea basaltis]|uniref:hypothetical protein n=1 Tax=Nonomuraea basaltis TaxID=2495887 RepID=UPI00110C4176|nr:hypothetical protein [Nonomuraea basaltis]TMR88381.1 hypothetical protein EJK15_66545 [Nonomuraea basaltis]
MKKGLVLLLVGIVAVISGCQGYNEAAPSLEECYKKDRREGGQLAREVGPLLAPDVRSTLDEGSACDSAPEGGAYISYVLDSDVPPKVVLEKFYEAGWVDWPQAIESCPDSCIAGISKKIDGRRIRATVQEFDKGTRMLEALFVD